MKTIKIHERGAMCFRPQGLTPLPQRWLRARKWCNQHHIETPNVAFLKEMVQLEMSGKG